MTVVKQIVYFYIYFIVQTNCKLMYLLFNFLLFDLIGSTALRQMAHTSIQVI